MKEGAQVRGLVLCSEMFKEHQRLIPVTSVRSGWRRDRLALPTGRQAAMELPEFAVTSTRGYRIEVNGGTKADKGSGE